MRACLHLRQVDGTHSALSGKEKRGSCFMDLAKEFQGLGADPLLCQAERIVSQRKLRNLTIDPDLLGEPGWDILLLAYVAHRRGSSCTIAQVADELNASSALVTRWVSALTARNLLVSNQISFSISDLAECKISDLLEHNIREMAQAFRHAKPSP